MEEQQMPATGELRQHLHDLLSQFSTTILVTHEPDGGLRGSPMGIARLEDDCRIWFFTMADTNKTREISQDNRVLIVCQNEQSAYLSLSGQAELVIDRAKIAELWQESFKVWFPEGKDDPNIELIHVHPLHGEFWDSQGLNKIQYLFEAAKAYVTGTTPDTKEGEQHGFVRL